MGFSMKLFKNFIVPALVAFACASSAQATTLTFDLEPVVNNGRGPAGYGDRVVSETEDAQGTGVDAAGSYLVGREGATPNVSVSYEGASPRVWTTGYSDLTNVLYVEPDGTVGFGFTLTADAGYNVTLDSFVIGNYGAAVVLPFISYTADGVEVDREEDVAIASSADPSRLFDLSPITGAVVSVYFNLVGLGGNSDNVGVDNITFSQSIASTPSPVPLPAGLPLLLAGLGIFGLIRRKA